MSVESTRTVMTKYFQSEHGDVSMMADDVVFTIMATGQAHRGRNGVMGMLNYFYHIAFDATAETQNVIFAEQQAMVEGDFVGKHIGEFAGIPATQKQVRVPIAVTYDLENDRIKRGRVYFEMPALLQQLGNLQDENKAFVRQYLNAISGKPKPPSLVDQYVADSDQAMKHHIAFFEAAFPCYELIADEMIAEGDKVVIRGMGRATHKGEFMGIPPTGKTVSFPGILIYRIANGKIVEHSMQFDAVSLMQQLGGMPGGS
ncbi:MAG: ester cyclase [Chloroflexi bacterium]|nr:ester cyclase [Chloroflexota bacterium]